MAVRPIVSGKKRFSAWDSEAWVLQKDTTAKSANDECSPRITGCCFLPDGRLVACDYDNRKIKVYDKNLKIKEGKRLGEDLLKSERQSIYSPYDVAVADETRVVVSMPLATTLQFIVVKPNLKLDTSIDTRHKCHGIAVWYRNVYVCINDNGEDEAKTKTRSPFYGIKIFSFEGNELSSIPHNGAGAPEFLCLNDTGTRIYYSGGYGRKAAITCINMEGIQIFRYSDKILQSPKNIALDEDNNVIICDFSNVYILNSSGSSRKYLLSENDSRCWLTCICYHNSSKTLLLAAKSIEGQISKLKVYSSKSPIVEDEPGACVLQ